MKSYDLETWDGYYNFTKLMLSFYELNENAQQLILLAMVGLKNEKT